MPSPVVQKLIDRFNRSRFFTVSLVVHIILVAIFGGTILFKAIQEPPDFEGEGGGFVSPSDSAQPPQATQTAPTDTTFTVTAPTTMPNPMNAITTMSAQPLDFSMTQVIAPPTTTPTVDASVVAPAATSVAGAMNGAAAAGIAGMTAGWGSGKGSGTGTGLRQREFEFTAYIGKYRGGNWNSTVRTAGGGVIKAGSLPNLLYWISKVSQNRIKTNERNVEALPLDSDQLFSKKPPFIFMTGSRDFKLTDKEVENLRKYLLMGGCIWGDSSVPGRRSAFDIAFRREMRRVIPDVDKDFEPLPKDHPIFTKNYYSEIRDVPAGLNYYQEPIYALKVYGQVSVIYTANDYGDMWQIGLNAKNEIDMSKDQHQQYIAINPMLWDYRNSYVNNLEVGSLVDSYKFGMNVITHLLTRWEDQLKRAPRL